MRYRPGHTVRVAARSQPGHHRVPGYLKGKTGTIEHARGGFPNPEERAYGGDGLPARPLYLVGFAQSDLWPAYAGGPRDRVYADLPEHWLEDAG